LSEFGQGLTLSGAGILITFGALGMLIVLILVLKALFPARINKQADFQPAERDPDQKMELRRRAAAVGVAVLLSERSCMETGELGSVLETPPGEWWRQGLDRIHGKE